MVDAIAFKTRARTVDHLGREQVADCPTAVSELWKNAYDAYARSVALHIFDGEIPTAAILDDGHGMSQQEFVEKWLVIGTESKAVSSEVPEADRNGLPFRSRQGQKGIGRLSSGYLGSLLLLVSKRSSSSYFAALIDWRLFENPFLYLQDIEVPIVEFQQREELWLQLPALFNTMMSNILGDGRDRIRDERIAQAWSKFSQQEAAEGKPSTGDSIAQTLDKAAFSERHLNQWPVWKGRAGAGTAMLLAGLSYDLEAQLEDVSLSSEATSVSDAKDSFFQTLCNFTDPYATAVETSVSEDDSEDDSEINQDIFHYSVMVWNGELTKPIISDQREFDYRNLEDLEHVVDGEVDQYGIFRGKIKAFGKWLPQEVVINPSFPVPTRSDSKVGPFSIRLGAYEATPANTTHTLETLGWLSEQAKKYGGLLMYRDGLRVMPYGREDNDYFQIEKRRTMHAGRAFWSYRRLFGRIALQREENPNLRDKAGREGLIDNKAAKVFRQIVINILQATAFEYFGEKSEIRKVELPVIQERYSKEKAEAERQKLRAKKRKVFGATLKNNLPQMQQLENELALLAEHLKSVAAPQSEFELLALREQVLALKTKRAEITVTYPPNNLGPLESDYREFRNCESRAGELIADLTSSISLALDTIKPKSARDTVYSELSRNATYLQNRLRKWSIEAKEILSGELKRISDLVDDRNKLYHSLTLPLLDKLESGQHTYSLVMDQLEAERSRLDQENADLFEPYISTLTSLQDSVDIETLVSFTVDESTELRKELDRLNSLAQLGITVEIIGHEIEGLDMQVASGLERMPAEIKATPLYQSVRTAQQTLVARLRFLSPLKLSGDKIKTRISGKKIADYINGFMGESLRKRGIRFEVTPAFEQFSLYELESRIYPVFVNIVNNSAYWTHQSKSSDKLILIDVIDGKIVVADDGPGVEPVDVKNLFTLFFTRKIRGGRGVGLYLCRANLAAGGHTISYATSKDMRRLSGANFIIDFKGAKYE
ncbi:ATP-binding protein [Chromobacterium subtsugae]|uniref:ATP-binding protein n=1 Tax=Chromobacterium subtsugae TaxID=251747 RepID=UPI000640EE00|nr:ATP-binding protein [Chromobacterium subtsugae]